MHYRKTIEPVAGLSSVVAHGINYPAGHPSKPSNCGILKKTLDGDALSVIGLVSIHIKSLKGLVLFMDNKFTLKQGGRSCAGARGASAEKFGLRQKF